MTEKKIVQKLPKVCKIPLTLIPCHVIGFLLTMVSVNLLLPLLQCQTLTHLVTVLDRLLRRAVFTAIFSFSVTENF